MPKSIREGSRARISQPREREEDSPKELDQVSPSDSWTLWNDDDLGGSCWRTSLASSLPITAATSADSFVKWSPWGMASRGGLLMPDSSGSHKGGGESSSSPHEMTLSEILEESAPRRFSLSAKACAGILRRANRRGKKLPPTLVKALEGGGKNIRRLTPAECEVLMGWPKGWTIAKGWTRSARKSTAPSKLAIGKSE